MTTSKALKDARGNRLLDHMEFKTAITMTKSIRDNGSPCRSPLRCGIGGPWVPLRSTRVLVVDSKIDIH